jgi:hypothetical protein
VPPGGAQELAANLVAGVLERVAVRRARHPVHEYGRRQVDPLDEEHLTERSVVLEAHEVDQAVRTCFTFADVQVDPEAGPHGVGDPGESVADVGPRRSLGDADRPPVQVRPDRTVFRLRREDPPRYAHPALGVANDLVEAAPGELDAPKRDQVVTHPCGPSFLALGSFLS